MQPNKATYLLLTVLIGCSSSPTTPEREMDPELEQAFREQRQDELERLARQGQFTSILLNLDKMIDSYVYVANEGGEGGLDDRQEKIADFLTQQVDGRFNSQTGQWTSGHYDELVQAASNATYPGNQSIALAALGFSSRPDTLSVLLNGVESEDFNVSNSAVLALAIFKNERTPPVVLMRCIDQLERPMSMRSNAAWALYQIQTAIVDPSEIVEYWKTVLDRPIQDTDPGVLVSAVRGMGLSRDAELASYVEKYVSTPTPQVRMAAAIALGRMQNQESYETLLALLGPAETNPNVRLAARKALQALAGGVDRGYSVEQWRKVFERGF